MVDQSLQQRQNIMLIYATTSLGWTDTLPYTTASLPDGQVLTDNFAPVERLRQRCW